MTTQDSITFEKYLIVRYLSRTNLANEHDTTYKTTIDVKHFMIYIDNRKRVGIQHF